MDFRQKIFNLRDVVKQILLHPIFMRLCHVWRIYMANEKKTDNVILGLLNHGKWTGYEIKVV